MELKKRKESNDYPQFQFRISKEDKKRIQEKVDYVVKLFNSELNPKLKKFKKNDVIVEALKRGLKSMEIDYKRTKKSKDDEIVAEVDISSK